MVQIFSRIGMILCLTLLPYIPGKAALQILYRSKTVKTHMADAILTGWIICIGAVEAVHLVALFWGRSFSDAVRLLAVVFLLLLSGAGVVLLCRYRGARKKSGLSDSRKRRTRVSAGGNDKAYTVLQTVLFFAFVLVAVYQVVTITAAGQGHGAGDLTAETVESFIRTDAFYQVNPLTGQAYDQGMPFRLKILCLPTLYAFLCKIFGLTATEVVWGIVPVVTLFGSYLAFYVLAVCLFPGQQDRDKRLIFMLFVAVLFCIGDYTGSMDGMGLLHGGYRGETIRNTVLVPYTFGLVLRRRWRLVPLCILAEACIVWTLYGMGTCLLIVALMRVVQILAEIITRKGIKTGKEDQA